MRVISKNEDRNMQMVTENGNTHHVPIERSKPSFPKTGLKNPKGGKSKVVKGDNNEKTSR